MKTRKTKLFTALLLIIALIPSAAAASGSAAVSNASASSGSSSAATITASVSGPAYARKGDELSVKFVLSGMENVQGIQADIVYMDADGNLSSPWKVEMHKKSKYTVIRILATDATASSSVISGTKTICTLKFKMRGAVGNKFAVHAANIRLAIKGNDGDTLVNGAEYTSEILSPLSKNADLSALTVSNAKISPSFAASKTYYTATVSRGIAKLNITAKAAENGAAVKVANNSLKAGATTKVTVTVTAPYGNTKTYTIAVKRL